MNNLKDTWKRRYVARFVEKGLSVAEGEVDFDSSEYFLPDGRPNAWLVNVEEDTPESLADESIAYLTDDKED